MPRFSPGRRIVLTAPYLWILAFFLAPMALILKISLSHPVEARPPYEPLFSLAEGPALWLEKLQALSLETYRALIDDPLYLDSYLSSLWLAAISTLLTLLVAYPFALAMARAPRHLRPLLVGLAIAPFWTSFLIRVYAWIMLLKDEGLINHALMALHLIDAPLEIYATSTAVVIGMVYSYLPFMLLPLYAALERQDPALREAAADLGASPADIFWRITLPLSARGAVAGSLMVFIPAVGEFVIPDVLGGPQTLMIGRTLWSEFFTNRDWPMASAVAILLLALLILPLVVVERLRAEGEG